LERCERPVCVAYQTHSPLRQALVLSPRAYNRKVGLAFPCPITNQVKSMDWKARGASLLCSVPEATIREVLNKIGTLVDA